LYVPIGVFYFYNRYTAEQLINPPDRTAELAAARESREKVCERV
jgi:hypothetical protein